MHNQYNTGPVFLCSSHHQLQQEELVLQHPPVAELGSCFSSWRASSKGSTTAACINSSTYKKSLGAYNLQSRMTYLLCLIQDKCQECGKLWKAISYVVLFSSAKHELKQKEKLLYNRTLKCIFTPGSGLTVAFIRHWLFIKSAFHSSRAFKNKTKGLFITIITNQSCWSEKSNPGLISFQRGSPKVELRDMFR